jgi:hypothetical protein
MRKISRLIANQQGSAALVVAVAFTVLIGVLAVAVDLQRLLVARGRMQMALDAAAQAGGASSNLAGSLDERRAVANAIFAANFPSGYMGTELVTDPVNVTTSTDADGREVLTFTAQAELPFRLMPAVGGDSSITIRLNSDIMLRLPQPVEVTLLLETSNRTVIPVKDYHDADCNARRARDGVLDGANQFYMTLYNGETSIPHLTVTSLFYSDVVQLPGVTLAKIRSNHVSAEQCVSQRSSQTEIDDARPNPSDPSTLFPHYAGPFETELSMTMQDVNGVTKPVSYSVEDNLTERGVAVQINTPIVEGGVRDDRLEYIAQDIMGQRFDKSEELTLNYQGAYCASEIRPSLIDLNNSGEKAPERGLVQFLRENNLMATQELFSNHGERLWPANSHDTIRIAAQPQHYCQIPAHKSKPECNPETDQTDFALERLIYIPSCEQRQSMFFGSARPELLPGQLAGGHGTRTNVGLLWAWHSLSPNWVGIFPEYDTGQISATYPRSYDSAHKVVVLVTEGRNLYPAVDDVRQHEVCSKMKSLGIVIYAITLQGADAATQNLVRSCATSDRHYRHVSSDEQFQSAAAEVAEQIREFFY